MSEGIEIDVLLDDPEKRIELMALAKLTYPIDGADQSHCENLRKHVVESAGKVADRMIGGG